MENSLARLRRLVTDYFNLEELRDLAFDLEVNYDALPAKGTAAKARELILYLGRQQRLHKLLAALKRQRPHIELQDDALALNAMYRAMPTFEVAEVGAEADKLRQSLSSLAELAAQGLAVAEAQRQAQERLAALQARLAELGPSVSVTGSGAAAQGAGAQAAGAGAVIGPVNAPVATGQGAIVGGRDVIINQGGAVGGIRAERIEAQNVVDGVQVQGSRADDAAKLLSLAQAIRRGGISAEEIKAGSVVSGLQFLAGAPPTTLKALRREITALRGAVGQSIAAGELVGPGDAVDVDDALQTAEAETRQAQPDVERIVRHLKAAADILLPAARGKGNVSAGAASLALLAAALVKLAGSDLDD